MKFSKYQGTGNDFIMIDNRELLFNKSKAEIAALCHRRFGIGADGVILLQKPPKHTPAYDFEMIYYNADGSLGSMCGNGGRCVVRFAHHLGIIKRKTNFLAVDGVHQAEVRKGDIHLKMNNVTILNTMRKRTIFFLILVLRIMLNGCEIWKNMMILAREKLSEITTNSKKKVQM